STIAFSTRADRSTGCWSLSLPLRRPRGVRRASTITALGIAASNFQELDRQFQELDRAVKSAAAPKAGQARPGRSASLHNRARPPVHTARAVGVVPREP